MDSPLLGYITGNFQTENAMNKAPKLIDQITADLIAQDGLTPELARRVAEVWIRDDLSWEDMQIRIDFILASAAR